MEKMRVAHIITRLDWGGSPEIFRILTDRLSRESCHVTLIIGRTDHPTQKTKDFLAKFSGEVISVPSLVRDIDPFYDMIAFIQLFWILAKGKFDIVHTHTSKAGALGRLAAKLAGIRVIIHTPHGHNFYGYFSKKTTGLLVAIERFLAKFTDMIIALTELEKRDYLKLNIAGNNKIIVIPQGLELDKHEHDWKDKADLKRSFHISSEEYVVGMVGRLESVKGPDIFIEAAYEIRKRMPEVIFIISGEGSMRKRLESRVDELNMKHAVIFTGWREDVPHLLSIFDVAVLPSRNEAVGMVILEAQAQGVPVVAANVGGVSEIIRDGKTGILVPPEDPAALAGAVLRLILDRPARFKMASDAKRWVSDKFMVEDMVGRTSELYRRLLGKKLLSLSGGI